MKNFQQNGDTIEFVASGAVSAGAPVELTDMIAVAVDDVADGDTGVGRTKGVFVLPKVTANDITQGADVYLNDSGVITTTATDNVLAGKAWAPAGNGTTEVAVGINV